MKAERNMKTMALETTMITQFEQTRILPETLGLRSGSLPEWLPAPAVARPSAKGRGGRSAKAARSTIWIPLEQEAVGEKLMLALLVVAAVAGVGYGFASLLDLVQNWGAFNHWVAQIM